MARLYRFTIRFVSLNIKFKLGIKPASVFLQEVVFFARELVNHMHGAFDVVVGECKL